MSVLTALAAGFGAVAVILLGVAVRTFRARRWLGTASGTTVGLLFASLAALSATLSVSTQGYRALTSEELAATITTVPTGPATFQAYVEFPDGRDTTLAVSGDQVLVDARILKWRSVGNLIGLRTQYELDRLTGRYVGIDDERGAERTVHSLGAEAPLDLYALLERYSLLRLLVDAEYGSATFVDVTEPARFEVRVSTTGLLIRSVPFQGRD